MLYAIGDIHGSFNKLVHLMNAIYEDIERRRRCEHNYTRATNLDKIYIVTLGDYIDRGPASKDVLKYLSGKHERTPEGVTFVSIMGNHDEMALDYNLIYTWYKYGGVETYNSFRPGLQYRDIQQIILDMMGEVGKLNTPAEKHEYYKKWMTELMGEESYSWISTLPIMFCVGKVICSHAGLHPLADKAEILRTGNLGILSKDDVLWSRDHFHHTAQKIEQMRKVFQHENAYGMARQMQESWSYKDPKDRIFSIHGHTPVHRPMVTPEEAFIDTRAYEGDKPLTALMIPNYDQPNANDMRLIQATSHSNYHLPALV